MESQVIWDSCWRRFEERYRLQVRLASSKQVALLCGWGPGVRDAPCTVHPASPPSCNADPLNAPQDVRVPREVVWLNGAPGSGKVRRRTRACVPVACSAAPRGQAGE